MFFSLQTQDGFYVHIGDWIHDTTGCYEIASFYKNYAELREIVFDDLAPESYLYGASRYVTFAEIRHFNYL